jgi:outer membrane protein assembly factor BamB
VTTKIWLWWKIVSALWLGMAVTGVYADWPTFRGEDRSAVSKETGLLDEWPEDGPKLVWAGEGAGRGYASPAVSNGRIYTLGDRPSTANDKDEYLTCFEEATGKQLWKTKTGPAWNDGHAESWRGSRGTPTVDGERVYVITPFGKLFCCKTSNGEVIWQKGLKEDLGGAKKDSWGYSESPLIDGDLLLCTPGGARQTVVALNKINGEQVWSCGRPGNVGAGHASIVISQVNGQKIYVQNTAQGPMGVSAQGQLLWSYDMPPPTAFIPSPIVKEDLVFSGAGYGLGGALLRQVAGRNGKVDVEEVYGLKKNLANRHGGIVLVEDKLYFGAEDNNIVRCADLKSGETVWEKRGPGSGSISMIAADGKLYSRFQNGVVALLEATPDDYIQLGSFKTPGSGEGEKPSWAHPVIANGKLLLRENDTILCYEISK